MEILGPVKSSDINIHVGPSGYENDPDTDLDQAGLWIAYPNAQNPRCLMLGAGKAYRYGCAPYGHRPERQWEYHGFVSLGGYDLPGTADDNIWHATLSEGPFRHFRPAANKEGVPSYAEAQAWIEQMIVLLQANGAKGGGDIISKLSRTEWRGIEIDGKWYYEHLAAQNALPSCYDNDNLFQIASDVVNYVNFGGEILSQYRLRKDDPAMDGAVAQYLATLAENSDGSRYAELRTRHTVDLWHEPFPIK